MATELVAQYWTVDGEAYGLEAREYPAIVYGPNDETYGDESLNIIFEPTREAQRAAHRVMRLLARQESKPLEWGGPGLLDYDSPCLPR